MENIDTLPKLVKRNAEQWPRRPAMCMKRLGIWQAFTWAEYYRQVKDFSLGLIALGLKPGEVLAIIGDNEPEWFWGEFAAQAAGALATGIFVDSVPGEVEHIGGHADARFALVNDQEQADKFLELREKLPRIERIIYWDPKGLKNYDDPALVSFAEVQKLGRAYEQEHPGLFEENVAKGKGDDIAFIYYTSGTTGLPKGACLSHRALIQTANSFLARFPLTEQDNLISNFPAAWVGDSYFATIPHLLSGARLNFPEEPETIAQDTREVGPNFVIYGPRQWESLVSDIQIKVMDAHPLKRLAYRACLPVGYKMADSKLSHRKPNLLWRALYVAANGLLFHPLKDKLGLSRVRFAVTGSSVLSLDTFRFLHAMGIQLMQNYGSTEAGYISSHAAGEIRFESVGRPVAGTEVRITDGGELLVRSPAMFSGYHKNPDKTKEVLAGGWCHTGDAVNLDAQGHIIFLDRLEHMGELSSGIKYAPQYIESRLRFSPYIKDAMVVGGKDKDYVSAIVNMDFAQVGKWAERHHLAFTTFVDLSQKDEVAELIAKDLRRVNAFLPEAARARKFVLLHKEFDPDEAELTRTRKLRRDFMEKRYQDLIASMYTASQEVKVEAPVTYRDGRRGVVTTSIKVREVGS